MSPSHPALTEPAGPLPYDLYIRLESLAASWPTEQDGGPGPVVACCGFQAAELSLRLVEDALGDARPAAFPEERVARFVDHAVDGVELTCRLLARATPPEMAAATDSGRAPSPGLAVLHRLDPDLVDQVTRRVALAGARLPFRIGVEAQLRDARRHHRLPDLDVPGVAPGMPVMDYAAVVSPAAVSALRDPSPHGPEDHLFATAHQITECWLRITHHYLADAGAQASRGCWRAAAQALRDAGDSLGLAARAGQLLDLMVLADYHPLRVRLRDGSGAQSRAVRRLAPAIRAAARPLWEALDGRDLRLRDVLEQPTTHIEWYRYLNALKAMGTAVQAFLFDHYLLALGVLGTHSLGSAGYEIRKLAERAAQPLFPEINQAHHDYVMITNFSYGDSSGSIVLRNELAHGWNPYQVGDAPAACPREIIEARVADYFRFIERRDGDEWVRLFDPVQGHLQDVPGTRPYRGAAHLRIFINGMFNAFTELRGTHSAPRIEGNTASVDWRFDAVSYHGQRVAFDGREDFVFADDGRILKAVAHWSPALVARQWRDRLDRQRQPRRGRGRRPARVPNQQRRSPPDA